MARKPTHAYGEPRACTRCGQVFPNAAEYFYPVKANQPTPLRSQCRPCYTTTVSEKWAKRKAAGKTARNLSEKTAIEAITAVSTPIRYEDLPAYQTLAKIREIAQRAEGRRALMADAHQRAIERWAARREQDVA